MSTAEDIIVVIRNKCVIKYKGMINRYKYHNLYSLNGNPEFCILLYIVED